MAAAVDLSASVSVSPPTPAKAATNLSLTKSGDIGKASLTSVVLVFQDIQKRLDQLFQKRYFLTYLGQYHPTQTPERFTRWLTQLRGDARDVGITKEIAQQIESLNNLRGAIVAEGDRKKQKEMIQQFLEYSILFFLQKEECAQLDRAIDPVSCLQSEIAWLEKIKSTAQTITAAPPGRARLDDLEKLKNELTQELDKPRKEGEQNSSFESKRMQRDACQCVLHAAKLIETKLVEPGERATADSLGERSSKFKAINEELKTRFTKVQEDLNKLSLQLLPVQSIESLETTDDLAKDVVLPSGPYTLKTGKWVGSDPQEVVDMRTTGARILGFNKKIEAALKELPVQDQEIDKLKRALFSNQDKLIAELAGRIEQVMKCEMTAYHVLAFNHREGLEATLCKTKRALQLLHTLTTIVSLPFAKMTQALLQYLADGSIESYLNAVELRNHLQTPSNPSSTENPPPFTFRAEQFMTQHVRTEIELVGAVLDKVKGSNMFELAFDETRAWDDVMLQGVAVTDAPLPLHVVNYLLKMVPGVSGTSIKTQLMLHVLQTEYEVCWQKTLEKHPILATLCTRAQVELKPDQLKAAASIFSSLRLARTQQVAFAQAVYYFYDFYIKFIAHPKPFKEILRQFMELADLQLRKIGQELNISQSSTDRSFAHAGICRITPSAEYTDEFLNPLGASELEGLLLRALSICVHGPKDPIDGAASGLVDRLLTKLKTKTDDLPPLLKVLLNQYMGYKAERAPDTLTANELGFLRAWPLTVFLTPSPKAVNPDAHKFAKAAYLLALFDVSKQRPEYKATLDLLRDLAIEKMKSQATEFGFPHGLCDLAKPPERPSPQEQTQLVWRALCASLFGAETNHQEHSQASVIEKKYLDDLSYSGWITTQKPILALVKELIRVKVNQKEQLLKVEKAIFEEALKNYLI